MDIRDYVEVLDSKHIRPSIQRVAIYKYFYENRIHPTAENAYEALKSEYPTLSLMTVYNTVHLLVKNNLLKTIEIEDDKTRYDANTTLHAHFKCTKCGQIYDLLDTQILSEFTETNRSLLPVGFTVDTFHINFWGKCSDCNIEDKTLPEDLKYFAETNLK